MKYPTTEGKNGPIYHIATGIYVGQNPHGNWEVIIRAQDKRKRKSCGKNQEGMTKAIKMAELMAAKMGLLEEPTSEKTFSDVADEWVTLNQQRWSPNTLERYSGILKDFVRPVLGGYPLANVTRNRVRELLTQVAKIRSPKSAELVHAVVSGIFSEAIELGYTRENPALGLLKKVLPPKKKRRRQMPDPFSQADLDLLLDAAAKHLPDSICLVLRTIAYSGMRLGECLAMHRDHLDIANCQYMVRESVRNGRFGEPKTGERLIDLPDFLVKELADYVRKLRKQALMGGRDVEYIFEELTQRAVQGAMKRACLAAKLRARSPHDLRHTYATLLLMAHYSPAYVQKQLGHHSITMTVDIYGHWIPGVGKKDLATTLGGQQESESVSENKMGRPKKASASVLKFKGNDDS